ncbi:hypothetical protein P20495_4199 [Pseudoalteromonas sp. BSi20495]|nr:hypothetical protein P20495_4199 [Pseudoalteromonas sp. BSi20495]
MLRYRLLMDNNHTTWPCLKTKQFTASSTTKEQHALNVYA